MNNVPLDAKAIFFEALEQTRPEELKAYLDRACDGNVEVRARVEELLVAHQRAGNFLGGSLAEGQTIDLPEISEKPGTQIGPYKLLQELGEGGMGVVYLAEQREPITRQVALKIIKPGMDSQQVLSRFEAERQALAMMDHPNIARVLDAGTTDQGRPYFVMELVKGIPINAYCDEHNLSTKERLTLFGDLCRALQHAHQKGIVHRDVKPTNVLVAEFDNEAVPKVIDFGVAKAVSQRLTERTMFTQFGQIVGTPEYMSPEQAKLNQLDVDTRSDIYSLGVLLYELLTGATPFDKDRLRSAAFDELLRIIREEDPPRPSVRLSTVDELPSVATKRQSEPRKLSLLLRGELDWIVMKAMVKERSHRYDSASAFADDIERYLNGDPVVACPPSRGYLLRKTVQRHKVAIATSALVFSTLLIGIAGTSWMAYRLWCEQRALEQVTLVLQQELFEKLLTAAMSGGIDAELMIYAENDAKVSLWKLTMIQGLNDLNSANPQSAIKELREAIRLAEANGTTSVAAEAILATAYFHAGRLHDWIRQSERIDNLLSDSDLKPEPYELLFVAQLQNANPKLGRKILREVYPRDQRQTGLSLAVWADIQTAYALEFRNEAILAEAIADAQAAVRILGETPFALQTELETIAATIALCRGKRDTADLEKRGRLIEKQLCGFGYYGEGAKSRAFFYVAVEEFENAKQVYREAVEHEWNPVYRTSLALLIFELGIDGCEEATLRIIDEFNPVSHWDLGVLATILIDSRKGRKKAKSILVEGLAEGGSSMHGTAAHIWLSLGTLHKAEQEAATNLTGVALQDPPKSWEDWTQHVLHYISQPERSEEDLLAMTGGMAGRKCDALLAIARVQMAKGQYDDARDTLESIDESEAPWHFSYQLADGLRKRLNDDEWLQHWIAARDADAGSD